MSSEQLHLRLKLKRVIWAGHADDYGDVGYYLFIYNDWVVGIMRLDEMTQSPSGMKMEVGQRQTLEMQHHLKVTRRGKDNQEVNTLLLGT